MAGFFGNPVARTVRNGSVGVPPSAWVQLTSSAVAGVGTRTNLPNRQWISLQARGPGALAITYTCLSLDGAAFATTVPSYNANFAKIIPANSVWQEPLSDDVMMWGRFAKKSGSSAGGIKVVVTEYS